MTDWSSEFPLEQGLVYLNHAMSSPWPRRTVAAINAFAQESMTRGALDVASFGQHEVAFKLRLRRLLNADSVDDIAILKNTAEGVSTVALGLSLPSGSNVVAFAGEYPSNRVAWASLEELGVAFRECPLDVFAPDPEAQLMAMCDEHTRVLAVSSVQFRQGFAVDLPRLGRFCRANDIFLVVDAIQSLGVMPFDLAACEADAVVGGVQKWLMAPEGIGWLWCSPRLRAMLRPISLGWRSRVNPIDFDSDELALADSARRFECGTISSLGVRAANASLSLVEELGVEQIWQRVQDRYERLLRGMETVKGLRLLSNTQHSRRSALLSFAIDGVDSDELFGFLSRQGVFCARRGEGLRFSPQFYTPMAQLDRVVEYLHLAADGGCAASDSVSG